MSPPSKSVIIAGILALAASFAAGRYLTPTKVKVETQIVEVEKQTKEKDSDINKHKDTTTHEITHPDGSKETVTHTVEDSNKASHQSETNEKDKTSIVNKEVTHASDKVTISALAALRINDLARGPIYGASVSKPILGPLTVGIFGLQDSTAGVSVGISF